MHTSDKLETLASAAEYDSCGFSSARPRHDKSPERFISRATLPNGTPICLFKVLLTNICLNDCAYCVNQIGRDVRRYSFQPDELARQFMELHHRRLVQGLFLTSGIGQSPSRTMASMIDTAHILRHRYEFNGYIHLKIMPGANFDCVEEACRIANRVSVNIEAPTVSHLARLSTCKDLHNDILERMRWVKQLTDKNKSLAPGGQTTQFVVGAAGESDRDILQTAEALYREIGLRRAYFSAFSPISGSRLENVGATLPVREHRLYQVDWLMRVYKYPFREASLALAENDNLSLKRDPKLVIAQKEPWLFPVDLNQASYDDLLRVPGIGPVSAKRLIETRREHSIFSLLQLKKIGVVTKRAAPFIWFQGITGFEKQFSFLPELTGDENSAEPTLAGILR